ncbi:MAG: cation:proton antiporter, partial [Endozoicomonas sp.]
MGIFGVLVALQFPVLVSLICASALALSSTAIVSKELTQSNEIRSRQGQLAIGVLLFQDIAAVLFLIMVPTLAGGTGQSITSSLGLAFAKGIVFVLAMLAVGKWLLPKIFHEVAKARSEELFVLMALVIALMAAWLSHALGLSMALGGFVAGMMLGESHYKHQVEADIKPFRDVLLGLFFVSVGLMLNMEVLLHFWWKVLLGTIGLILFKFFVVYALARTTGEARNISLRASLSLAQGGEFCFALIALASQYGQTGGDLASIVLAVTILSMIAAPLLIRKSDSIAKWLKYDRADQARSHLKDEELRKQTAHIHHHTLICGYGRVGQTIARFLAQEKKAFVAIDDDPLHVHEAGLAGDPVFYGDCRKLELLQAVGLERASQVVICIDRSRDAIQIVKAVRQHSPSIPILVRTRDDSQSEELQKAGSTVVIPEVLESSLLIVKHALLMLGMNPAIVLQRVNEARAKGYEIL